MTDVSAQPKRMSRGAVAMLLSGIAASLFIGYLGLRPAGESKVRAAADAAAYELERTPVSGLGLYIFDIQEALSVGARDSRGRSYASSLKVTSAGEDARGDLYEITNSRGDHPVCLAVRVDINLSGTAPAFPTTEVTDGRC
jgi:hypothetical protein